VLAQPECLELLVADGGSTDKSLQILEILETENPRLRIVSRADTGPADALNKAFRAARGSLIGLLNAQDLYPLGALARAVAALKTHPQWLMVYGEAEEFNKETGLTQHYPTLPASVDLSGFRSHCFICQSAVVFRRSMGLLLGEFESHWHTTFYFDYWLRAFTAFPHRIGYLPHLQGRIRLHGTTSLTQHRAQVALEATELLGRNFGAADATQLHNYAIDLQLGIAELPAGQCFADHLQELVEQVAPWLAPEAFAHLQGTWLDGELPLPQHIQPCRWRPGSVAVSGTPLSPFCQRPFGVNLIGHAFEVFGIGEDIRMAARALQAAGVPCSVIHYPAANGAECSDRSLRALLCGDPTGGPYAFNLVCMAAPIHAHWLNRSGCDPLRERYTLTSWPWETQQWPAAWTPLLDVADELWPSSTFTAASLKNPAAGAGIPLQVMPMAAEVDDPVRFCSPEARAATRSHHSLPADAVLFGYGFDLNSTAIRKNPMAALEAFQLAFPLPHLPATFGRECNHHPLSNQVALLIKTFSPLEFRAEWHWLQARAAEDIRITLIAESLPRDELLSLYGCCDVFLSLHRSEGFGRGMAEALQLGVDVIATDFGGNTDFCSGPLAHPVRWRRAPIPRGAYPYADGHSWAEPDLEHAADLCRKVASRRLAIARDPYAPDPSRDPVVLAGYRQQFSFAAVGARYRARLDMLWADRVNLGSQLRWRRDRSPLGCEQEFHRI
jgi:hypothetical protein